jgi:hypothetical protein
MARIFNFILDEFLGNSPPMKSDINPQPLWPIVAVEGIEEVFI